MKRYFPIILIFLESMLPLMATHNRAGEITLTPLGDYTYEIKITTFTYTLSDADRDRLEIYWGDNSYSYAPRRSRTILPNYYQKNIYTTRHTFPGPGTFEIVVQDPNRNQGVKNIPNSVNVIFSVKTTITINPVLGQNSTPVLLNPPIDRAALNQEFIHNPAAYDPDGDSISYSLAICTEDKGKPIDNYSFPRHDDTLYIDPISGDLIWRNPIELGIYNIAINIEEWRMGVKIGNIVRDMQIEVFVTDNRPPEIDSLWDYCVEAGGTINFDVIATDPDTNYIALTASGGPLVLEQNPAVFTFLEDSARRRYSKGVFTWETNCYNVREQVYSVVFKAEDDDLETALVDLKNVKIRVVGKAPATPIIIPASNSMTLLWNKDSCPNVRSYNLYRKSSPSGYTPDSCVIGVPAYTGYELIASINDRNDTVYFDDNNGNGLEQGNEYCYLLTSVYPDGAESYPSEEVCSPLVAGMPAILQSSVTDHGSNGSIELKWAVPPATDTLSGPFRYEIKRYGDLFGQDFQEQFIKNTVDKNDTTFIDLNVDTDNYPYSYSIALFAEEAGIYIPISDTSRLEYSSTFYPQLIGGDNKVEINVRKNVPWINYEYTIYRYNNQSGVFDSIGTTSQSTYTDTGLANGNEYCYMLRSKGWRSVDDRIYENENISHINCTMAIDTVPPCEPILNVHSVCEEQYNRLSWKFNSPDCLEDIVSYNIYFSPTEDGEANLIESEYGHPDDSVYNHYLIEQSMAGCYYVTAVDSFQNESARAVRVCVDECTNDYILPNVFTPNGDEYNNIYKPSKSSYVERVDFQVYNRWGNLVFKTEDPDLNWDGKILDTDKLVSPGVYYYICEVFRPRLGGIESRTLTGFIHVFSGEENDVIIE